MDKELIDKCKPSVINRLRMYWDDELSDSSADDIADEILEPIIPLIARQAVKEELKAMQDFYQTTSGDIVIPKADWEQHKEKVNNGYNRHG